jgi:hypothetical protein
MANIVLPKGELPTALGEQEKQTIEVYETTEAPVRFQHWRQTWFVLRTKVAGWTLMGNVGWSHGPDGQKQWEWFAWTKGERAARQAGEGESGTAASSREAVLRVLMAQGAV